MFGFKFLLPNLLLLFPKQTQHMDAEAKYSVAIVGYVYGIVALDDESSVLANCVLGKDRSDSQQFHILLWNLSETLSSILNGSDGAIYSGSLRF
jgi:hypothetical protein